MYSAVLMLALTAGNDTVDFGRNRCHGCSAPVCSTAVVAHCTSSACTARFASHGGHGCARSHGCSSSFVGHGCSNSCRGGGRGLFNRGRGCHGCSSSHGCTVGYGCTGGVGCTGGTIIVPGTKPMPKSEPVKDPKKASINVPATIVVSLPADARLFVDGTPTTSTSDRRTLVTPGLETGSTFVYEVRAEIVQEGRTVAQTQQVSVRGGETTAVQFNFSTQTVATR